MSRDPELNSDTIQAIQEVLRSREAPAPAPLVPAVPVAPSASLVPEERSSEVKLIKRFSVKPPVLAKPLLIPVNEQVEEPEVQEEEVQEEEVQEDEKEDAEYLAMPREELLLAWEKETDFSRRDQLIKVMTQMGLFPSKDLTAWEREAGLYPDTMDPEFLQKLLLKREFAESLQSAWKPRTDPCRGEDTFEVTPVQRFVSQWMSPKTPYLSALLYHGVGVGKTCAAIQIAEAWLEQYPSQPVMIVCPPTIKQGFLRTIFDISKVVIGTDKEANTASQCTGVVYMKLSNTLFERDPERIVRAVTRLINRRYKIFGYVALANHIRHLMDHIPVSLSEERREELMRQAIRKEFSHRLLMVDEAHNLRDVVDEAKGADEFAGGKAEEDDVAGGKLLTPYLRQVLGVAEGMKFCALTATPMYNTYREIIFLLNLLLMNDKKATLREQDIFDRKGGVTEAGQTRLAQIAQHYISFMRGENPVSFPVRLFPEGVPVLEAYPVENPRGGAIPEEEAGYYRRLPLVAVPLQGHALVASEAFTEDLPPSETAGLSTLALAKLVQAGNLVVPETVATRGDTVEAWTKRTSAEALRTVFTREVVGGRARYRAKEVGAGWLSAEGLAEYAPKFSYFVKRIQQTEGCVFAYTRFIGGGALPLALALEANGYTLYGRKPSEGLLVDGIQAPGGRQCALCPQKEQEHVASGHTFRPAYYGLLTGDVTLSPRNDLTIQAQRAMENAEGAQMKVIIGSQIASEGVDLRFVRETHVLDSWFHLNKTEQILGRAIRYLSHCALPTEKRNNTVYLYATYFPVGSAMEERETADLYSYRLGFRKAVTIGRVTRILKQSAIDCNLNREAIVISGEAPVRQVDSQRKVRSDVNINDMPFTAVCDWMETCDYTCSPVIAVREQSKAGLDDSTYDEFAARWRMERIRGVLRKVFERQPFIASEDLWNIFSDVPRFVIVDLLQEVVGNKSYQVAYQGQQGYVRYCNGYYLFQPNVYMDVTIPLSIRVGRFPIKRDAYLPLEYDPPEVEDEKKTADTLGTLEEFWRATVEWVTTLTRSDEVPPYPDEIQQRRFLVSQGDRDQENRYEQILEMIRWIHRAFHSQVRGEEDRAALRQALLFHFWDEWLRLDEQLYMVYSSDLAQDESVMLCIQENQVRLGRLLVHRFYQAESDATVYLCEEGTECQASVVDAIRRDPGDRLRSFRVTPQTTGSLYGFLITKNGELVFKTSHPSPDGEVTQGKECGNVSNKVGHMANLTTIGQLLEKSGRGDMDLNVMMLLHRLEHQVRGLGRICTLMNMMLRFLDAIRLGGRRWFFRPLAAHEAGHVGFFRRGR